MTVLIARHAPGEGPGYFADFLQRHGVPFQLVKVDEKEPLPQSIDRFSGLVLMGGPMSVNDPLPWIPQELALIRAAIDRGKPVLGHCLGAQLMSKALGGQVTRNPVREIGWYPVRKTTAARNHAWLHGLPSAFEVFHWHGETFSLPPGGMHLLENDACAHQAFALDGSFGMQCHVEITASMVRAWAASDGLGEPSRTVQTVAQMEERLIDRVRALHAVADVIYTRWLQGLR